MSRSRRAPRGVTLAVALLLGQVSACSDPPRQATTSAPSALAPAAPRLDLDRPPAESWDRDRPEYSSAPELCAYLNAARDRGREHPRFRGDPWKGSYHDVWTWPVVLEPDGTLAAEAQEEAERLAAGGEPPGTAHRDSSWRRPVWFAGIGTGRQQMSARDVPGDWDPASGVEGRAAIIETNGALRLGLLHQDGGGATPVLRHMGCGMALAPDARARWWVVVLGH